LANIHHHGQQTTHNGQIIMKITKDEILYVADLARLNLDEAAIEKFAGQIGDILDYVDKLNEVNTDGVKPTSHAISLTNAFREDEPQAHLDREQVLANAPEKEEGNFIVPKVVG
jgi:aspartyl-tRNA(Asn)/glutamyl-tRNA(Gln) amidotransferase subunit C